MKKILNRYEIENVEMVTVEVGQGSCESEEFLAWLLEKGFDASMSDNDCGDVFGDFTEDDNDSLGTALWEAYCNEPVDKLINQ